MTDNPNYVPVDWPDDLCTVACTNQAACIHEQERIDRRRTEAALNAVDESACPANCSHVEPHHHVHDEIVFTTLVNAETVAGIRALLEGPQRLPLHGPQVAINPEAGDPARETVTLNSAGDPIKIGDRVHHVADVNASKRSVGVVTYVGPVEILSTVVENGVRCKWDDGEKEEPHHADQLTVLL